MNIAHELARINEPAEAGQYSEEEYQETAVGISASVARTEYVATMLTAPASPAQHTESAKWKGKCKACFLTYEAGDEIATSDVNPRLKVRASPGAACARTYVARLTHALSPDCACAIGRCTRRARAWTSGRATTAT